MGEAVASHRQPVRDVLEQFGCTDEEMSLEGCSN